MSAARKRLRVWVNVYGGNRVGSASDSAKNAREVFVGRSEAGDRVAVPFVESIRGDVVVSREAWSKALGLLDVRASDGASVVAAKLAVRAVLRRGGR